MFVNREKEAETTHQSGLQEVFNSKMSIIE